MAGLEGGLDLGAAEHLLFFSANDMSQLFHLGFPHPKQGPENGP